MKKFVLTILMVSNLYTLCVFAQAADTGNDGRPGTKGVLGEVGRAGRPGSVEYLVIRNDLDLDTLLIKHAHEDYLRTISDKDEGWEKRSQSYVEGAIDIIVAHSKEDKSPTLSSGE